MVFWVGGDGDCDFRSVGSQGPAEASREQVGKSLVPHPGVAWGLGVADGQRRLEVITCPPPSYLVPTCGPYSCSLLSPLKSSRSRAVLSLTQCLQLAAHLHLESPLPIRLSTHLSTGLPKPPRCPVLCPCFVFIIPRTP